MAATRARAARRAGRPMGSGWSSSDARATGRGSGWSGADGTGVAFLAPMQGTNHPLPSAGERVTWSPDGTRLAFISATPGTETEDANGDPMVITRYLYKPHGRRGDDAFQRQPPRCTSSSWIWPAKAVRQLTDGPYYEHSIDWSPRGDEILFVSNREPDPDRFFNYDIFTVRVADGAVRAAYRDRERGVYARAGRPTGAPSPSWAPSGPLTSSETTMEDTHVWLIDADGSRRRELGAAIDDSAGRPRLVGRRRARSTSRCRSAAACTCSASPWPAARRRWWWASRERCGSWSAAGGARGLRVHHARRAGGAVPPGGAAGGTRRRLTDLNAEVLAERRIAPVEAFTFASFDGREVEAFLTTARWRVAPGAKHPLIVLIHGGPHGQQGPAFDPTRRSYADPGLGHADGELPRLHRLRTGASPTPSSATRTAARPRTCWRAWTPRSRATPGSTAERLGMEGGSYGGQLGELAHHADRPVRGRHPDGRHLEPGQLQLHGLLPRLPGRGVRRLPAPRTA